MSNTNNMIAFMSKFFKKVLGGKPMFRHEYYCETLGVKIYCNEIVGFFCCICSDD